MESVSKQDSAQKTALLVVLCARLADEDSQSEMHYVTKSYDSPIKVANTQMHLQIDDLQKERMRLLHRLNKASTHIGQRGIRFVGLSPEHLEMVRVYASALPKTLDPRGAHTRENATHELKHVIETLMAAQKEDAARIMCLENTQGAV